MQTRLVTLTMAVRVLCALVLCRVKRKGEAGAGGSASGAAAASGSASGSASGGPGSSAVSTSEVSSTYSGPVLTHSLLTAAHVAELESICAEAVRQLCAFYQEEAREGDFAREMFLDTFEDEYRRMRPLRASQLLSHDDVLLPPTDTPLTGISFEMRRPCGNKERIRKATQVFLLLRKVRMDIHDQQETTLPLRQPPVPINLRDSLNLSLWGEWGGGRMFSRVLILFSFGQTTAI